MWFSGLWFNNINIYSVYMLFMDKPSLLRTASVITHVAASINQANYTTSNVIATLQVQSAAQWKQTHEKQAATSF